MRCGYDPPSEASSLFSRPMGSRAPSTAATPLEDFRASRYPKEDDIPEGHSRQDYFGELSRTTTLATSSERGGSNQSHRSRIGRRGTTKELVGRYESMSSDGTRTRVGTSTGYSKGEGSSTGVSAHTPEKKGIGGRSPIRQSFRNFLSVFSKKGKPPAREPSLHVADLLSTPYGSPDHEVDAPLPPPKGPTTPPGIQGSSQQISNLSSHPSCTTPVPLYAGRLFHLCSPVIPDGLPIWAECNVVLHLSHILITWHSVSGNPSTSMVSIGQCTDVRSLNVDDLASAERGQLPNKPDCGGLKVFELLFTGQRGEKFAASSVKERAGWVNAIWDVVLRVSEETTSLRRASVASDNFIFNADVFDSHPPSHYSLEGIPESPEQQVQERTLPPLPVATPVARHPMEPLKFDLYDPPVPTHTPPPKTPTRSTYSTHLPTPGVLTPKSQSPSLRNLDQRSMVRQRLAQLERTSSPGHSPITPKSTRSRQIIDSPSRAESPSAWRGKQSVLLRHGTITSIGQDSIIDSYAGEDRRSQLSSYTGRLTSIPSAHSGGDEGAGWLSNMPSKLEAIQQEKNGCFSPASRYSDSVPVIRPFTPPPARSDSPGRRFLEAYRRLPTEERPPSVPLKDPTSMPPAVTQMPAVSLPDPTILAATVEQKTRLSGLRQQLSSVQTELRNLPEALNTVAAERPLPPINVTAPTDIEAKQVLQTIGETVKRVEDQGGHHSQGLDDIRAKVDQLLSMRQTASVLSTAAVPGLPATEASADVSAVLGKIDELREQLQADLPALSHKIEEILAARAQSKIMKDAAPADSVADNTPEQAADQHSEAVAALQTKLEEILSAIQAPKVVEGGQQGDSSVHTALAEILELAKSEQTNREAQLTQQTDSARYLNELNTWLETFVKHGTAQIEAVAGGVQQLCQELGPIEVLGEHGQPIPQQTKPSILADIRQLLADGKGRDDGVAALQASMNTLALSMQEGFQQSFQAHTQIPTETIVALIDGQRRDQEQMLRNLAAELSDDIRGERLRFVEAMKEATTINVQIHVEEFKKELTREVMLMTSEVTRLHKERQGLEQQIADLFAFYAKQKQTTEPSKKKGKGPPPDMQPTGSQGGGRRPLPNPGPGTVPGGMW